MRNLTVLPAAQYRRRDLELQAFGREGDAGNGVFVVPAATSLGYMFCIVSNGAGWDHVSVSRPKRIATWADMERAKRVFFADDETAMQLHVPVADHLNHHPRCLHLWRPQHADIPRPPSSLVAPPEHDDTTPT